MNSTSIAPKIDMTRPALSFGPKTQVRPQTMDYRPNRGLTMVLKIDPNV